MKVKALKSFIGKVSMNIDDEREIIDKKLAEELIKAGHVMEVKADKKETNPNKNQNKNQNKTQNKNQNKK